MATKHNHKLHRVSDGLYSVRRPNRSFVDTMTVSFFPFGGEEAKRLPWVIRWKDWMSTDRERRFAKLSDIRTHLDAISL